MRETIQNPKGNKKPCIFSRARYCLNPAQRLARLTFDSGWHSKVRWTSWHFLRTRGARSAARTDGVYFAHTSPAARHARRVRGKALVVAQLCGYSAQRAVRQGTLHGRPLSLPARLLGFVLRDYATIEHAARCATGVSQWQHIEAVETIRSCGARDRGNATAEGQGACPGGRARGRQRVPARRWRWRCTGYRPAGGRAHG